MGRRRSFDEHAVVVAAATAFTDLGYEATSVDDLLLATGLQRGSLYQAFGSKRGLFLAALQAHLPAPGGPVAAAGDAVCERAEAMLLDLLLVATLELAPRDTEVRALVVGALAQRNGPEQAALVLGRRLLERAHIPPAHDRRRDPPP